MWTPRVPERLEVTASQIRRSAASPGNIGQYGSSFRTCVLLPSRPGAVAG
jgi:hypothetical protein